MTLKDKKYFRDQIHVARSILDDLINKLNESDEKPKQRRYLKSDEMLEASLRHIALKHGKKTRKG